MTPLYTVLYFVAGIIAVLSATAAAGGLFVMMFLDGMAVPQGVPIPLLVAAAFVFGLVAWWAARKGANRWPY